MDELRLDGPLILDYLGKQLTLFPPDQWVERGDSVIFHKMQSLVVFVSNGAWDPRILMNLDALSYGLMAGLLYLIVRTSDARVPPLPLKLFTLALFGLPLAWVTITWNLANHMYHGWALSALAFGGMLLFAPSKARWWLGLLAVVALLLNNSSALLTVVALSFSSVAMVFDRARRTHGLLNLVALIPAAGYAVFMSAPTHGFAADSVRSFLVSLQRNLSWPFLDSLPLALLMPLPAVLFVLSTVRLLLKRRQLSKERLLLSAFSLWAIFLLTGLAYSRGAEGIGPWFRHYDLHVVWLFVNVWIALRYAAARGPSQLVRVGAGAYLLLATVAIGFQAHVGYRETFGKPDTLRRHYTIQHEVVAAFLADPTSIEAGSDDRFLQLLKGRGHILTHELLRERLPFQLRMPFVATSLDDSRLWFSQAQELGTRVGPVTRASEILLRHAALLLTFAVAFVLTAELAPRIASARSRRLRGSSRGRRLYPD